MFVCLNLAILIIASRASVWPIPRDTRTDGKANVITIDRENLSVMAETRSEILERASKRYQAIIRTVTPAPAPPQQCDWQTANIPCNIDQDCATWVQENCHPASTIASYCKSNHFCHFSGPSLRSTNSINQISVQVSSDDESLNIETNESYSIHVNESSIVLKSESVYGAIRGLETLAQIAEQTEIDASLVINDEPVFPHRGLSVDASRRFLPVSLLKSIIDGLSISKMNVLHIHFTDEPAFRLQIDSFPELTKDLGSAVYSKDDVRTLISYAKDRGVRIIPEIDVPGHAGGFRVLGDEYVDFCDEKKNTLAPTNKTMTTLQTIFTEVSNMFEDEFIHAGFDEVCKHDVCPSGCSFDQVHLFEKQVQDMILSLKKKPIGWNDVFSDPKQNEPNAAEPGTLIQNWGKEAPEVFAMREFNVIDSTYREMYLNQQCCTLEPSDVVGNTEYFCFYRNHTGSGLTPELRTYVQGGEVAMWSDSYCPSPHCAINGTYGWMYDPSRDDVFSESYSNMIFPHASAAAGSLWSGYSQDLVPKGLPSDKFIDALESHTFRLRHRNVSACKSGCSCDWYVSFVYFFLIDTHTHTHTYTGVRPVSVIPRRFMVVSRQV